MRLYVLGGKKLGTINVNDKTQKSISVLYKYNETLEFPINMEKKDDKWALVKNDFINIEKDGTLNNYVELENYKIYFLNLLNVSGKIASIPTPTFEKTTYNLEYKDMPQITIGSNPNSNIRIQSVLTSDNHAIIKPENGIWTITAVNNSLVYVNGYASLRKELKTGDFIFINGVKIIWNTNYIRVNNPTGINVQGFKVYAEQTDNQKFQPESELVNVELYEEKDYYYPKLLITNGISEETISIDPPPAEIKDEETPLLISIGTSVTLLGSSFMMGFMIFYNISSGRATATIIPQIVMCVTMLFGSLIMPRIVKSYNKKKNRATEKKRQELYGKYLEEKQTEVNQAIVAEQTSINENHPSASECLDFIKDGRITNIRFWSKSIKDNSFINVRLGNGDKKSSVIIGAPEKGFTMESDNLEEKMFEIKKEAEEVHNVAITLDLARNNNVGMMIRNDYKWQFINSIMLQLAILHSPYDLKIIVFTNKENKKNWDYAKYLPHMWSDDRQIRFFATNIDEMQTISEYLSNEYRKRKANEESKKDDSLEVDAEKEKFNKEDNYKNYQPYYLLIDDNYFQSKNTLIVDLLNETGTNFGFSYLGIGESLKDFPSSCDVFVEVNEKTGNILEKNMNRNDMITFNTEYINPDMRKIVNQIANVPIKIKDQDSQLPQTLQFLEMLDASRIEQLNVLNRWKTNNPVVSLATPVGVHKNGEKFKLDLHEKAHGPHGLIAGMTGSGKSEFIITYILSMIINYHPYEVQFVLIDYKGGGLAGAFENKEQGYKIPHLVGTITNLDTAEMNRTLVSIQSECKRRQQVFNEVRDKLGESTIDIYKYQKLYREGLIKEPMAHLFIISDEFAELKSQQPDFMNSLISVARIGRSLGIHLILATQKPSGVVNDQIWSNSKFKVCLKVQDKSDSMEMLKKPDAASIKETGRFYLQVGYDDYFDIGQSGWSGAKYVPTDNIIKKIDDSINFVSETGNSYKSIKNLTVADTNVNLGDQLTNIVKNICEIAKNENIKTKTLWLDKIPEDIYIQTLKQKYNYKPTPYLINPLIGEYDNPSMQQQGLINLDLTNKGNTLIYGQAGSGKENLLTTIVTSIALEHNPSEVNIYIMDFGSESLRILSNLPHVGDIATIENPGKVEDTFSMLYDIMEERKKLFADYSGSYNDYINNSGNKLPLIVVIINNYELFTENFSRLSDAVSTIYRDAEKYGIVFIITSITTSGIRSRIAQFFENKIALQLPDANQYRDVVKAPRELQPSNCFGRGLIEMDDTAYEFQTANVTIKEKINETIRTIGKKMNEAYPVKAKPIPTVPDIVTLSEFENKEVSLNKIPIGYDINTKNVYYYDASSSPFIPIVTENMTDERMSFVYSYIHLLTKIKDTSVKIIDLVSVFDKNDDNLPIYKDNFDTNIVNIYNDIATAINGNNDTIYVFLGIGQLKKMLNPQSVALLNKLFLSIKKDSKAKFVFIDTYVSYKNLSTEEWYQSSVDATYGIWLGENVGTQLAININNLTLDDRKIDFPYMAFAVNNGKHKLIRYVVEKVEQNEE